jgi:hypothetical protein
MELLVAVAEAVAPPAVTSVAIAAPTAPTHNNRTRQRMATRLGDKPDGSLSAACEFREI